MIMLYDHWQGLLIIIAESKNAIKWFSHKKMIVNPDKFKTIVIQKGNQTIKPPQFLVSTKNYHNCQEKLLLMLAVRVLKSSKLSII